MLTRPGSPPGPAWMKRLDESAPHPSQPPEVARRWWKWYWLVYGCFMVVWFLVVMPLLHNSTSPRGSMQSYESETRIAGLPLVARGLAPHGIVAIGGRPTGIIAIGGLAVGIVAIGGLAVGVFSLSGVAVGILALGGGAVGWWALGGAAVGYNAFAGLAVGAHAYAGQGIALGYYEASGRQKERLFG